MTNLIVFGINHTSANTALREQLLFTESTLPHALHSFMQLSQSSEALILSTCHRTEIYAPLSNHCALLHWLAQQKNISPQLLKSHAYTHHDDTAILHAMRVASGMDSMILGEPQVLGQMKEAYAIAQSQGAIGDYFSKVFPAVFSASKTVRTQTAIAAHPVTLAFTVLQLIKKECVTLKKNILLIGTGKMIELIATHLHEQSMQITIANRTREKAETLANRFDAKTILLQDIPAYLHETDIVISATASPLPIIGKGMMEHVHHVQKNKKWLLIDLAMPRDIEPEVKKIPNVALFHLDDLKKIIDNNTHHKKEACHQAEVILKTEVEKFSQQMRVYHARHVIARYRAQLENIRDAEFQKALAQLKRGIDPEIVLTQFGNQLLNKILHHPTVKLREAAAEEQCELFQNIKKVFEL